MNKKMLSIWTKMVFILSLVLILSVNIVWAEDRYYNPTEMLVAPTSTGTTYYVDATNGSDSYNGLYPDFQGGTNGPFKTIGKATDRYSTRMKGGNTVKIKAGLYRERISLANITGNTDEQHRYTIGPYGDGEVIIDGSDTHLLTWSQSAENPNIWVAPCELKISGTIKPPTAIVLDDNYKQCRPVYQLSDVNSFGRWWYDATNKQLYLYTKGTNPTTHGVVVITEDRDSVQYAVKADLQNYVTVYGLTVRGAGSFGIWMTGNYCTAEKNNVKYNGKTGIFVKGTYGKVLKNRTYGNVLLNWPRGKTWDTSGGWPNGGISTGSYGYVSGNIVDSNGGEGIGCMNGLGSVVVEDNIVSNSWSANIYLDSQPNDIVRRNLVYNDDYDPANAIDVAQIPTWSSLSKIEKRMIPNGIMMGDEIASQGGTINYQIYNNIIINTFLGISHYMQRTDSGFINSIIANNTIIMPDALTCPYGIYGGFELSNKNSLNVNSYFVNNVIVSAQPDQMLLHIGTGADNGVVLTNNLYYAPNNPTPMWLGSYPYTVDTFDQYKNDTGLDVNSLYADPQFAGVGDVFSPQFYLPAIGSPLVNNAVLQALYSTDFNNSDRGVQWSIGALAVGSSFSASSINNAPPTAPPTTSITYPLSNSIVINTVSVTATAYAIDGINRIEFLVNGVVQHTSTSSPYAFNWDTTALTNGTYTLSSKVYSTDGNSGQSSAVMVTVNNPVQDTTAPAITAFTMPTTSTSLTVPISSLAATDNVGVTGYLVVEGSTPPVVSSTGWSATAPTSFTFSGQGTKTAYAWAKDAAGNLSNGLGKSVTITIPDTTAPAVSSFLMPSTSTTLTVAISSLIATDNVGVTGYLVTESSLAPLASDTRWTTSPASSITFSSTGSKTAYAWAKDAAGNVSASRSASVTIALSDTVAPTVSTFALPLTSTTLVVPVSSFTATDKVGVTGYMITESAIAPDKAATGWASKAPTAFTFSSAGSKTAYAWAKDAAGNVSASRPASITITLSDITAPTVSIFTLPLNSATLTVPVSSFTATDNVGVTGYMITESAITPNKTATGWSSNAPTSFVFSSAGSKMAYAWAKDAAGNVSASRPASITISISDKTAPTVSTFILPLTSTTLTVPVYSFIVTDNVAVTGYMMTESSIAPDKAATGWSSIVPSSYTFSTTGTKTLYAWAKDAAGNVSTAKTATVVISIPKTVSMDVMVVSSSTTFPSIQDAYNTVPESGTIAAKDVTLSEQLNFNRAVNVNLAGGMDATFQPTTGSTAVSGAIKISNGKVVVSKIIIR